MFQEEPLVGFRVGEHLEYMQQLESKFRRTILPDMQNLSKPWSALTKAVIRNHDLFDELYIAVKTNLIYIVIEVTSLVPSWIKSRITRPVKAVEFVYYEDIRK